MKKAIGMVLAAVIVAGCASYDNRGTQALDLLAGAILQGTATYEQLAAIEAAAAAEKVSTECAVDDEACATVGGVPPAATPAPVPTKPQPVIVPADGKAVAVILGASTCGWTKKFMALGPEAGIEAALPLVDVIYADKVSGAATYAKYRPREGFSYPLVRVFDASGVFKGEFVARSITLAAAIEKVKALAGASAP